MTLIQARLTDFHGIVLAASREDLGKNALHGISIFNATGHQAALRAISCSRATLALQEGQTSSLRENGVREVDILIGDPSKAHNKLACSAKIKLPRLVEMMVEAHIRRLRAGQKFI